ncbi:hypothetical protein, partial [Pseudarthrobacter sp. NamE5]|uniref:hypothetical protein n=1 Tax=Pseudarthrobacter sp. NamE5 TaxID=2576839 RepID=UPI00197A71A9
ATLQINISVICSAPTINCTPTGEPFSGCSGGFGRHLSASAAATQKTIHPHKAPGKSRLEALPCPENPR